MSSVLLVQILGGKDKFSQKCTIPFGLFERTNLKIDNYATLKSSDKIYICRIYASFKHLNSIYLDDIVACTNSYSAIEKRFERITFPDDFAPIKPHTFSRITVKIIQKGKKFLKCDKGSCENVIRKILSRYVISKQYVVNCCGLKIADLHNIQGIMISETFPEECMFGRVIKTSHIEIVDIMSYEQILQKNEFKSLQLGGVSNAVKLLELNLISAFKFHSVLISGPSGCGKSSVVKVFSQFVECFLIVIDGSKDIDLSNDKCNMYSEQFSSYLNMFPEKNCILFIDHIDAIAPYNSKQKVSSIGTLITLIHSLKNLHVFIVATAVRKGDLSPNIAALFGREINLGMPSCEQRKEIIDVLAKSLNCNVDCDKIARMTPGFVGHDLSVLMKEAINISLRKEISQTCDLRCVTTENFEEALASISPSALRTSQWKMKVKPVHWKDIGGMFHVKKRLQMCIEWPLHNSEIFKKLDLPCPRGVLLFGPPGCCKTTLARRLATDCNANFFAASPAQIYSCYVGESEKNIMELFYQARLCSPSIIFFDELDSLVSRRKLDTKSQGIGEKVLSTLLTEMDGFGTRLQFQNSMNMQKLLNNDESIEYTKEIGEYEPQSNDGVIVVAATNRPDLIDDALLRPGRFDIILYVPPPDLEERESILNTVTEGLPIKDVNMKMIAENTNLFSGADLKYLYNEASMNALRESITASYVTEDHFNAALTKIQPSISQQQLEMYEKLSSKYGSVIKTF